MNEDILNLTNLKYFCDTVRLGGLSPAAKANFVTQSAISQGITKLEKSLKVSLVAHHPNRFRLTPKGDAVFKQGLAILKKTSEFTQNISGQNLEMGSLDFACTHSFALAVIPKYIKRFREEHPEVKINFYLGKNEIIKQMVKEGTIDFGILPDEGDLSKFENLAIYKGNFRTYVAKQILKKEQKKLGFILAPSESKETILFNEIYAKKYGNKPSSVLEVSSWEVISNFVAEGMGIGFFPDYIAKKREDTFQECDLGLDHHQYRISAISPSGMKIRKSSEIFLSYFLSDL